MWKVCMDQVVQDRQKMRRLGNCPYSFKEPCSREVLVAFYLPIMLLKSEISSQFHSLSKLKVYLISISDSN
jgi:hypothetical protein